MVEIKSVSFIVVSCIIHWWQLDSIALLILTLTSLSKLANQSVYHCHKQFFSPLSLFLFQKSLFHFSSLVIIIMLWFYQAVSFQDRNWSRQHLHSSLSFDISPITCFRKLMLENMHRDCLWRNVLKHFWKNVSKWNRGPDSIISLWLPATQCFRSNLLELYASFT